MGKIDLSNSLAVAQLFTKIDRNAAATIIGTDVSNYRGTAFVIDTGAHTSGTGFTVTFQHRDAAEAWANIPNDQLTINNGIALTVADINKQIYVGYTGSKEDVGAVLTRDGSGVMVVGVLVLKGAPVTQPPLAR